MNFKKINPEDIEDNCFKLLEKDWMLITAGNLENFNTMTASWGGFGVLWHKKVAFCVVRPTRYTYQLLEANEYFTLSFFDEKYRDILMFCGTQSGKNVDKIEATGLIPIATPNESVYFMQSRLVMECRKLYYDDIKPANFCDVRINDNYPAKDYHRLYIGEIVNCQMKND